MFKKEDIKKEVQKDDIIQVITPFWNGGIGQCDKIEDNYITVVPVKDEAYREEYQSITHSVILPIEDIHVLIKVNKEEIKND